MSVQPAVQVVRWKLYVCHSVESSSVLNQAFYDLAGTTDFLPAVFQKTGAATR